MKLINDKLSEILFSFALFKILSLCVKNDIFEKIENQENINVDNSILKILEYFKLIKKKGNFYKNSKLIKQFFLKNSKNNLRSLILHLDENSYPLWGKRESLNFDKPILNQPTDINYGLIFDYLDFMNEITKDEIKRILKKEKIRINSKILDVGGGKGFWSNFFNLHNALVTYLDRPEIYSKYAKLNENIRIILGDFFQEKPFTIIEKNKIFVGPIPKLYDVILFFEFIHGLTLDKIEKMLIKALQLLKDKGVILIKDFIKEDLFYHFYSLHIKNCVKGGFINLKDLEKIFIKLNLDYKIYYLKYSDLIILRKK